MTGKSPRLLHISYATSAFLQAALVLRRAAARWGIADTTVYTPESPVAVELREQYPGVMTQLKGAGYWLWKPFILRDALARARDGDVVLYTDAGAAFIASPEPLLDLCRDNPIVLFEQLVAGREQRIWTKRDCFRLLEADAPEYWETPQVAAGFQLYRAGPEAKAFVDEFCSAVVLPRILTDSPNTLGHPDLPGFREHRHDQSVLTILAVRNRIPRFPDPSQFGPRKPMAAGCGPQDGIVRPEAPYGQIFHLHRMRDTSRLGWYRNRPLRRYTNGRFFV
jgi:endonuclease YncB( thermonuclease family)